MVADGLVAMKPGRGREVHVFLTDKGRELAGRTVERVMAAEQRALEAMTQQQSDIVYGLLRQNVQMLREELDGIFEEGNAEGEHCSAGSERSSAESADNKHV